MKIIAFSIENLRSVRERQEVTELSGWEVLHGDNNVGKSNLLLGLRCALAIAAKFGVRDVEISDATADLEMIAPGVALLGVGAGQLPSGLEPHRDRATAPIRVAVQVEDAGGPLTMEFTLTRPDVTRSDMPWRVEGRWARRAGLDLSDIKEPTADPLPLVPPTAHFVDSSRQPPPGAKSWDDLLLTRVDADRSGGPWLAAYRRLERALASLIPAFATGRLDHRLRRSGKGRGEEVQQELIWRTDSDILLGFDDQGSGVRALKDLLVAATMADGLCILEEPEAHLSDGLQRELRTCLLGLSAPGCGQPELQLILTSHTAMFDHPGARRVSLQAGSTLIEPARRRSGEGGPNAAWLREGAPNAGYATGAGVLLLPPSVVSATVLPALMTFIPAPNGGFFMCPTRLDIEETNSADDVDET